MEAILDLSGNLNRRASPTSCRSSDALLGMLEQDGRLLGNREPWILKLLAAPPCTNCKARCSGRTAVSRWCPGRRRPWSTCPSAGYARYAGPSAATAAMRATNPNEAPDGPTARSTRRHGAEPRGRIARACPTWRHEHVAPACAPGRTKQRTPRQTPWQRSVLQLIVPIRCRGRAPGAGALERPPAFTATSAQCGRHSG